MPNLQLSNQITRNNHAYLILGNIQNIKKELLLTLEKNWKIDTKNNPDFIVQNFDNLYIENSREIINSAYTKPVNKEKFFIICFSYITREASNSFLKLFEEPIEGVTFFIITPNPEILPKTLKSRFIEIKTEEQSSKDTENEAKKILEMNLGQRFEYSKKLANEIGDEKKVRADALAIFEAIEKKLIEKYSLNPKTVSCFKKFEKCRSYLHDSSNSIKMIFDEVALTIAEINNL